MMSPQNPIPIPTPIPSIIGFRPALRRFAGQAKATPSRRGRLAARNRDMSCGIGFYPRMLTEITEC